MVAAPQFDPVAAAAQIRAYLAGKLHTDPPTADADEQFAVETERLRKTFARTIQRPAFLSYARAHPDRARAVVVELRALLDDIEKATAESESRIDRSPR
ncbi:hypothetical protein [Nonomuraea sp. NPDC049309]|uniref:hypothetical protein n=1 Tax=Nonomuraea sp. NPDC049309 TaxID=3364350 RepID=UPI0037110620